MVCMYLSKLLVDWIIYVPNLGVIYTCLCYGMIPECMEYILNMFTWF